MGCGAVGRVREARGERAQQPGDGDLALVDGGAAAFAIPDPWCLLCVATTENTSPDASRFDLDEQTRTGGSVFPSEPLKLASR